MSYDIKCQSARLRSAIILFISAAATVAICWPGARLRSRENSSR